MNKNSQRSVDSLLKELREAVRRDSLCTLNNQAAFLSDLKDVYTPRDLRFIAIMDVNNFKRFNTESHEIGDAVLTTIGEHIGSFCDNTGAIGYRIGGDEFAVVMTVSAYDSFKKRFSEIFGTTPLLLSSFIEAFSEFLGAMGGESRPVTVNGVRLRPTLSVGVAPSLDSDDDCPRVADRAGIALSVAKQDGKRQGHCFKVYDDSMKQGPKLGQSLRQTCTGCGSTITLEVHPDKACPPAPPCPICQRPLEEMVLEMHGQVGPTFPGPIFGDRSHAPKQE